MTHPDLPPTQVLLVEDDAGDALLVEEHFARASITVALHRVSSLAQAIEAHRIRVDCVLLDLALPDARDLEALTAVLATFDAPVVVLTGFSDHDLGVAAVAAGAEDYLAKNEVDPALLERSARYAIERHRTKDTARQLFAAELRREENLRLERGLQLILDLLAFSRVGRTTSGFVPVNLRQSAEDAIRNLEDSIRERGAVVNVGDLPTVSGDPTLMTALYQNLISNAIKFTVAGAPIVELHAHRVDDGWELACVDNGIGIEPQHAERVFMIFQRLHGRDAFEGTGIGLALCQKIVTHHGGTIWIDPEVPATSSSLVRRSTGRNSPTTSTW